MAPQQWKTHDRVFIDGRYFISSEILKFINDNKDKVSLNQDILPFLIADNRINLKSFLANSKCKTVPSYLVKSAKELDYYLPMFKFPVMFQLTNSLHIANRVFIMINSVNDHKNIMRVKDCLNQNPGLNFCFDEVSLTSRRLNVNLIYDGERIFVLPFVKTKYDINNVLLSVHPFSIDNDAKFLGIINCIKNIIFALNTSNIYTFELLINNTNNYAVSSFFPSFSVPGILHTHGMKFSAFDYYLLTQRSKDAHLVNARVNDDCMYIFYADQCANVIKQLKKLSQDDEFNLTYELVNLNHGKYLFVYCDDKDHKTKQKIEALQ